MKNIHENSISAYYRILPKLSAKRQQVLEAVIYLIQRGLKPTLKTICHHLGAKEHQISGRLTELKQMGLIVDLGNNKQGCSIYGLVDDPKVETKKEKGLVEFLEDVEGYDCYFNGYYLACIYPKNQVKLNFNNCKKQFDTLDQAKEYVEKEFKKFRNILIGK